MIFSFAVKCGQVFIHLLIQILLVRLVSKSTYGEYSFAVAVFGILGIVTQLGLPELTMREVANAAAKGLRSSAKIVLRSSLGLFALNIAILVLLILSFNRNLLSAMPSLDGVLVPAIGIIFFSGIVRIVAGYYRGLGEYLLGLTAEGLFFPAIFLCLLVTPFIGQHHIKHELSFLVNLHFASLALVASGLGIFYWATKTKKLNPPIGVNPMGIGQQFRAAATIGAQHSINVLFTYIDIVMLTVLASVSEVAEYRVAAQLGQFAVLANVAITAYFAPRIAAANSQSDRIEIKRIVRLSQVWATVYAVSAGILFALLGPRLVSLVFGAEYDGVFVLALILIFGHVVNIMFGPLGVLLNMTGHQNFTLYSSFLSLALNAVLNFVLISYWGVLGAAIATAIALIVSKFLAAFFVLRLGLLE